MTKYSERLAEKICDEIAEGKSLRQICRKKDMPGLTTIRRWLRDKEEFRLQYTRAREDQADYYADEIIEIADDENKRADDKRLMIDARKWAASKLKPKKYGDKLELAGHDGGPLIPEINVTIGTSEPKPS
ncbi:hypothetical protein [Sneathiella glossodoripedis]|uniref:terminase small subunit-like protein n=1 Tax=Sneathiella glossodoripedis TaxID=418853 RepID=UPI000472653C|nr:hypothetical protein [Sneathiella glossodoripedis]